MNCIDGKEFILQSSLRMKDKKELSVRSFDLNRQSIVGRLYIGGCVEDGYVGEPKVPFKVNGGCFGYACSGCFYSIRNDGR